MNGGDEKRKTEVPEHFALALLICRTMAKTSPESCYILPVNCFFSCLPAPKMLLRLLYPPLGRFQIHHFPKQIRAVAHYKGCLANWN